ncbi:MAG: pitrilysin family protein, partial [Desulfobacteraceae bacterium]
AGIADEPDDKNGLAHLVEHLMFRGTSNRNSIQIARFMDEAGGQMGGFITRDYTCFSATVLDDYRTFAIDLLGDILLNSLYSCEDIEREKRTILQEIETIYDTPDQRTDQNLKSYIWNNHYLGKSVNGYPEMVSKLTRDDVVEFVEKNYLADRIIIAAAGNVDHQDFVAQVQDAFWRMDGISSCRMRSVPQFFSGVTVEYLSVSQVYFSIGIRALAYNHPCRYDVHIANKILGGGISSRLFRHIREERGLVYDISSEYHAYQDDGVIVIEASTSPEYFMEVINLTLTEIYNLFNGNKPIDEEELWKAKMQIRGQHLISSENSNTLMSRLVTQELYFAAHISSDEILGAIDNIDLKSMKNVFKILQPTLKNRAIAVIGPHVPEYYDQAMIEALWAKFN